VTRSAPAQRSFASGEIAPILSGRHDYLRHQTGLAACRGFIPLREGPVTRAPGTRHLGRTRDDAEAARADIAVPMLQMATAFTDSQTRYINRFAFA